MIKLSKNSRGFTLLEMVIVIAIITIISIVIFYSIKDYLDASKGAQKKVNEHNSVITYAAAQVSQV